MGNIITSTTPFIYIKQFLLAIVCLLSTVYNLLTPECYSILFQKQDRPNPRINLASLSVSFFYSIVGLGTVVLLLFISTIIFIVREVRHRGQKQIMNRVLYQVEQDRIVWLDKLSTWMASTEAIWDKHQAEEAAVAAQRGQVVPLTMPTSVKCSPLPEKAASLETFSSSVLYNTKNPFERVTSSSSTSSLSNQGQSAVIQVEADVHAPQEAQNFQDQGGLFSLENKNYVEPPQPEDLWSLKKFSVASSGIVAKLQSLFRPSQPQETKKQPFQRSVQGDVATASIRRASLCRRQAKQPATLPRPNPGKAKAALIPLPPQQVQQDRSVQAKAKKATPGRRAPPPPTRTSSLRRSQAVLQPPESNQNSPIKSKEDEIVVSCEVFL